MPLISGTIQIPGHDLLGNGRVWRAKGIQSKIKKETKKNIRAGGGASGEHDPDAIRHTPNLKHDKADFEEETIEDLLKPPTPWTTPRKALDTPFEFKDPEVYQHSRDTSNSEDACNTFEYQEDCREGYSIRKPPKRANGHVPFVKPNATMQIQAKEPKILGLVLTSSTLSKPTRLRRRTSKKEPQHQVDMASELPLS